MREKKKVLFICTHNSARSQMAEGLLNALGGDRYEAFSAGTEASDVRPQAVEVMREIGIDISDHYSKGLEPFLDEALDVVVTVCDHAKESCPYFPGGKEVLHKGFDDPSAAQGTREEKMRVFRRIRDEIRDWIQEAFLG
ncbi:MAG: arsenate reductase ArsC [Desulfatiglandales bacterium]